MNINDLYLKYVEGLQYVILFINDNFGNNSIIERKNKGIIPYQRFHIKNSKIKGYSFHGYGCDFYFKDYGIDIEIIKDDFIGFSNWSFYNFCKKENFTILETETMEMLLRMQKIGNLKMQNDCFCINPQLLDSAE